MRLTDRQRRELEYHREHAKAHEVLLPKPFYFEVFRNPSLRCRNPCWRIYTHLVAEKLAGKRVLIVGCGFGDDALWMAKLGAQVYAFDSSEEYLAIARRLAEREGLGVSFEQMPAEALRYPDGFFDAVIARDILHHVDIPKAMPEIRRVSKPQALFVACEIYSHSLTGVVRNSRIVARYLYSAMQRFVYGPGRQYITEDERKLTQTDLRAIERELRHVIHDEYSNLLATRIEPEGFESLARLERILRMCLIPLGRLLPGRILMTGRFAPQ